MKVLQEFFMHQETVSDEIVTIVKLHFNNGDRVRAGDTVMDVETSKAVLEIDADVDGIIEYRCKAGDETKNGTLLFLVYDQRIEKVTVDKPVQAVESNHSCSVIRPIFSKKALALLRKHNIPEDQLFGRDFVTLEDVKQLKIPKPQARVDTEKKLTTVVPPPTSEKTPLIENDVYQMVKISPSKKTEISYLSKVQSAGLNSALHIHVDVEGLFTLTNMHFDLLKDTLLPIVAYETAMLLKDYKEFNAFYADDHIAYYKRINIGIAVDIDDGLKVITLHDTDNMVPKQIENVISQRIDQYLNRNLKSEHITGSTFTISDLSSQNLSLFQPLINRNQSAILGLSGYDKKLGRSTLSLVFDHRVTEGMRAGQFLNDLKDRIESYVPSSNYFGIEPEHQEISISTNPSGYDRDSFLEEISCHQCRKTLKEDKLLSGPGLVKIMLTDGRETTLCRDCLLGF